MGPREDEVRRTLTGQWLYKADIDLDAADALLHSKRPLLYPACFHCQQAAEKFLKALLTWHQIEFGKTHIIGELLDLLSPVEPQLPAQLASATALNPYGVQIRYPGDMPEPEVREARKLSHSPEWFAIVL